MKNITLNEILKSNNYKDKTGKELKIGDVIEYDISLSYQKPKILKFLIDIDKNGLMLVGIDENNKPDYNYINRIKSGIENILLKGRIDFPFPEDLKIINR